MILPRRLAAGSTQMKGSEYAVAPEQGKKTDVDHKGIMVIKLSVSEYWIQVEQNSCNSLCSDIHSILYEYTFSHT